MSSSDRAELMNPQQSVSTATWQDGATPLHGYVGANDQSAPAPPVAVESGKALEEAGSSIDIEEKTLWEGETSTKNFLLRIVVGSLFTIGWVVLAVATWSFGYSGLAFFAWGGLAILAIFWLVTAAKVFRASRSHHYRLTPRRLFVRTGLLSRRLDQVELLRVKDVYVRQTLLDTWLGIGHVVVISSEQTLPRATLFGIEQPRTVMDLIWRQTRAELDRKTSRIEHV
jgi:membrane protein YdbS with pleckstrin-like domain